MNTWHGRRVLITGAGGFIGSHLTERLVALGARTRALVRYTSLGSRGWLETSPAARDVEFVHGDIADGGVVGGAMRGVDVVFHLAALIGIPYSYVAPASYIRVNIEGTAAVLDAARAAGVARVVHTSTSEVYGTATHVPMSEEHRVNPQSPYAASKAAADMLAMAYHRSFGLDVVTLRPFNCFGSRQSARAVIPTIVAQALSRPEIHLGHLSPTRDYTHVSDTVEGFIRAGAMDGVAGQTFNLGSGQEIAVGALAEKIQVLLGTARPVVVDSARERPSNSEVERLCADATRARVELGWAPRLTLDEGLRQTIDWIRPRVAEYRPESYGI
jgi:NAD dependent epimerase/dehydratase